MGPTSTLTHYTPLGSSARPWVAAPEPSHPTTTKDPMTSTATTPTLRNRHRVAVAAVALLALGLTACGGGPSDPATAAPATPTTTVQRPTDTRDGLVRIGHGRMRLRCVGQGTTTVVLIAGWGDGGDSWGGIEPDLAPYARVCSYARFGTGTSDVPPTTQTFADQAADLGALLDHAGEPGPYVLLGHSFGGATAVTFAAEHPNDVRGLLLLDATPVTWPAAVCSVPDDGTDAAGTFQTLCADMKNPANHPERLDVFAAFDAVATIDSLGDLPMAVVPATHRSAPGIHEAAVAHLDGVWSAGVERWAALSSGSKVVPVEDTGHYIHLDHPQLVVDEILALVPSAS